MAANPPSPSDVYAEITFSPSTEEQRNIKFISRDDWTKKEAAYYYTQGSCVNNEPLYGAVYSGPKDVTAAVTKHNPNLTKLIDGTAIPKDTWIRTGQGGGTISGVFGIDIRAEIAKMRKGKRSNKEIAKELTKKFKGTAGTQKAFMSTSFASNTGFLKEAYEFHIFAPKGTKCLYAEPFSAYGDRDTSPTTWDGIQKTIFLGQQKEFEGILQRGTEFRIIGFEYDKDVKSNTKWRVVMEIVKQAPQPYQPGNPVTY